MRHIEKKRARAIAKERKRLLKERIRDRYWLGCNGCYCLENENSKDKHYALSHSHGGIVLTLYEDGTYWFREGRLGMNHQDVSCGYWEKNNDKVTLISDRKIYHKLVKREDNDNHKNNYGYVNFKAIYSQRLDRICKYSVDYTYKDARIEEDSLLEVFNFYKENTLSFVENDTIYALSEGRVGLDLEKGDNNELMTVKHISTMSFYKPCKKSLVKWGDSVKKGQPIGIREGDTLKTWVTDYPF